MKTMNGIDGIEGPHYIITIQKEKELDEIRTGKN